MDFFTQFGDARGLWPWQSTANQKDCPLCGEVADMNEGQYTCSNCGHVFVDHFEPDSDLVMDSKSHRGDSIFEKEYSELQAVMCEWAGGTPNAQFIQTKLQNTKFDISVSPQGVATINNVSTPQEVQQILGLLLIGGVTAARGKYGKIDLMRNERIIGTFDQSAQTLVLYNVDTAVDDWKRQVDPGAGYFGDSLRKQGYDTICEGGLLK